MLNPNLKLLLYFLCLQCLFIACKHSMADMQLEEALEVADSNRQELEQVLNHYKTEPLKYAAASFLIRNMPDHYSYSDTMPIIRYSQKVDSILVVMKDSSHSLIRDSIESVAIHCGIPLLKQVEDIKIMKADYLINNIDDAFDQWQNGDWLHHLSFDDFCEYILPYKTKDFQLLDDWRYRLKAYHDKRLKEVLLCDVYAESALEAARTLNWSLRDSILPNHATNITYTDLKIETKANVPFGTCEHYADITSAIMRAHGIPVMQDFTPQWAFRSKGHSWNVVLANSGKNIPFSGICSTPGEPHKMDDKMPKVYRYTYAQNMELKAMNSSGEYIPNVFRDIFVRDVTKEYIMCADVNLTFSDVDNNYIYLAVFDDKDWSPVAFAKSKNGRVLFKDMGVDIMYIAIIYDTKGRQKTLGNPFILNYDGTITEIKANPNEIRTINLTRKYPTLDYVYGLLPRMEGGEFHASNDKNFKTYQVIHKITDCRAIGFRINIPDSIPPCRYWRYYTNRRGAYNSMAEIMFFEPDSLTKTIGVPFGCPESWDSSRNYDAVFDGDILTYFDSMPDESWVGMDFGRPIKLNHLFYFARGDGNCIEPGDKYELYFWNEGKWKIIGKTIPSDPIVTFDNIPQNCLLLLKDVSKGENHRIFTYENEQQKWW